MTHSFPTRRSSDLNSLLGALRTAAGLLALLAGGGEVADQVAGIDAREVLHRRAAGRIAVADGDRVGGAARARKAVSLAQGGTAGGRRRCGRGRKRAGRRPRVRRWRVGRRGAGRLWGPERLLGQERKSVV